MHSASFMQEGGGGGGQDFKLERKGEQGFVTEHCTLYYAVLLLSKVERGSRV